MEVKAAMARSKYLVMVSAFGLSRNAFHSAQIVGVAALPSGCGVVGVDCSLRKILAHLKSSKLNNTDIAMFAEDAVARRNSGCDLP